MLTKENLEDLYVNQGLSMMDISKKLACSPHKVSYWMERHELSRRSISDAIYQKHNPNGDPFSIKSSLSQADTMLLGMGLGLYWGEGTKANKYTVRLGNTDPALIKTFIRFLIEIFDVDKNKLKFGLQIFTDLDQTEALNFWCQELDVLPSQFYKVHVTISGSIGTYKKKSKYGVVTVYFSNKKLRDLLVNMLPR